VFLLLGVYIPGEIFDTIADFKESSGYVRFMEYSKFEFEVKRV